MLLPLLSVQFTCFFVPLMLWGSPPVPSLVSCRGGAPQTSIYWFLKQPWKFQVGISCMNLLYSQWRPASMYPCILPCFSNHNDCFCPPPTFWTVDRQSNYYVLAGFSILLMLINVLVIFLKVFWIEVILLWRDIARPYKTRNGKRQVSSFTPKEKVP